MTIELNIFNEQTDGRREQEGAWCPYKKGAQLLIARLSNPQHKREQERLEAPYKKQIRRGTLPQSIARRITAEAMAKTVLLDWKGVKDAKGKDVAYTPELGAEVLQKDLSLQDFVIEQAANEDLFRDDDIEEIEKKSSDG